MAFTDDEVREIKYRLGYGSITALANPWIETALAFEQIVKDYSTDFIVGEIRNTILPHLRQYDTDHFNARKRLKARQLVGEVILNPEEQNQLDEGYMRWLRRLSSALRIPIAPQPGGSGAGGSTLELR